MLLVTRGLACFGMQPGSRPNKYSTSALATTGALFLLFLFLFSFLDHDMPFELMRKIPTIKQSLFIT
jgi:hypothetical protein